MTDPAVQTTDKLLKAGARNVKNISSTENPDFVWLQIELPTGYMGMFNVMSQISLLHIQELEISERNPLTIDILL